MTFRSVLLCAGIAALATSSFAQLSNGQRDWGESAAQLLMTKQESTAWVSVRTDAAAQQFIEEFWARRDPTPGTPENEFRRTFEQRCREADKRFPFRRTAGSMTDRGKVFILFGEPDHVEVNPPAVMAAMATPGSERPGLGSSMAQFNRRLNVELWTYRGEKAERMGSK